MTKGIKEFIDKLLKEVDVPEKEFILKDVNEKYGEAISTFESIYKGIENKTAVSIYSNFLLLQAYNEQDEHFIAVTNLLDAKGGFIGFKSRFTINDIKPSQDAKSAILYSDTTDEAGTTFTEIVYYILSHNNEMIIFDKEMLIKLVKEAGVGLNKLKTIKRIIHYIDGVDLLVYFMGQDEKGYNVSYKLEKRGSDNKEIYISNLDVTANDALNKYIEDETFQKVVRNFTDKPLEDLIITTEGPIELNKYLCCIKYFDKENNKIESLFKIIVDETSGEILYILNKDDIIVHYFDDFIVVGRELKEGKWEILYTTPHNLLSTDFSTIVEHEENVQPLLFNIGGTDRFYEIIKPENIENENNPKLKVRLSTFNKETNKFDWEYYYMTDMANKISVSKNNGMVFLTFVSAGFYRVLVYMKQTGDLYRYSFNTLNIPKEKEEEFIEMYKNHFNEQKDQLDKEYELYLYHSMIKQIPKHYDPDNKEVTLVSHNLVNITQNYSLDSDCKELIIGLNSNFLFMKSEDGNTYCCRRELVDKTGSTNLNLESLVK